VPQRVYTFPDFARVSVKLIKPESSPFSKLSSLPQSTSPAYSPTSQFNACGPLSNHNINVQIK